MEIFQTIWTALTTENEGLIYLFHGIGFPCTIIEMIVTMLFSTTLLNIHCNKKQKILYVLILCTWSFLSNTFIPKQYSVFINLIVYPITILFIFKTTILKSIVADLAAYGVIVLLDSIFVKVLSIGFNLTREQATLIPIYRESVAFTIYATIYLLYRLSKHFNFNITLLDDIDKKSKLVLLLNSILAIVSIGTQFYLVGFYNNILPLSVTLLSMVSLLAYFLISIFSLTRTTKLQIAKQNLEEAQLYNKSLRILHDNIRAFKHDFSNIVQAIGGYVDSKDLDGLGSYYSQLLEDCQRVNNLTTLSPDVINNPAIYSIFASKYHRADEIGIKINLEVFLDLNEVNMKIYEFTRILGILMDNAIEASSKCDKKVINVSIRKDFKSPRQLVVIENTYTNKDVDTDKIFEKGYTSKTEETSSHGLGLWEVRQVLKKNNNLNLYTTKNSEFFNQQLEIYA